MRGRPASGARDHPRIRGEHSCFGPAAKPSVGSSPHTRGALSGGMGAVGSLRIIPAYAGSTPPSGAPCARRLDHPRIRGEHDHAGVQREKRGWIIPAYAGSTNRVSGRGYVCADHPRIRGEHPNVHSKTLGLSGSSPHTRGALGAARAAAGVSGIIPAYAGSTEGGASTNEGAGDHPRIRGEHVQMNRAIADGSGSSPHTRGALVAPHRRHGRGRIIPAYAGSTR